MTDQAGVDEPTCEDVDVERRTTPYATAGPQGCSTCGVGPDMPHRHSSEKDDPPQTAMMLYAEMSDGEAAIIRHHQEKTQ